MVLVGESDTGRQMILLWMDDRATVGTLRVVLASVVGFVRDEDVDLEHGRATFGAGTELVGTLVHWDHPKESECV